MNQETIQDEIAQAREKLSGDIESLVDMRPLPEVAMKVNSACSNDSFDTLELTTLVECDPVISSKILSVVNSSIYGYSREVSSIKQALVVLGRKNISQMAMAIAAESVFDSGGADNVLEKKLYDHSLSCASVAMTLAGRIGGDIEAGTAFLAGMLHDIGKLALLDVAPLAYGQILENYTSFDSSVEEENEKFGMDHAIIGNEFANVWGLSSTICDAITDHHLEPEFDDMTVTQVTMLANRLVRIWGIGHCETEVSCEHAEQWLSKIDIEEQTSMQEEASTHFQELKTLLTC